MSDQAGAAATGSGSAEGITAADPKGKGKAVNPPAGHDTSMDEDDDSSEGEGEDYEEAAPEDEEDDEDNMEEISTANIIADGRRTRGKNVNFAEAAANTDDLEDDEDDDEDFEAKDDDDEEMQG